MTDHKQEKPPEHKVSRRNFLKGVSAFIATSSIGTVLSGCETAAAPAPTLPPPASTPTLLQYPEVPAPPALIDPGLLRFFTSHEARTVEAFTARLLPGTPEDPGAREAGVTVYIDNLLAFGDGFAEATYREAPFMEVYEGDAPPADDGRYRTIWVSVDEVDRYGYQSILTPREVYRTGIIALDQYARSQYDSNFVSLTEAQQDQVIADLLDNKAATFNLFSGESFFHVLRRHTSEGMFSDPAYGGNRDMVGWKLIGYPGAQRAYTVEDIRTEGTIREPQSLDDLPHFHPGQQAGENVILPVSGSDLYRRDPDEHQHDYP